MTAPGEPSPRAETDKANDSSEHSPQAEPASAATLDDRVPAAGGPRPRSFGGMIQQLFQEVKHALTGRDEPAPSPKRRRTEETRGGFRLAARNIMRGLPQLPVEAYVRATAYLADTLDWLNRWLHQHDHVNHVPPGPSDHLYPHPQVLLLPFL